MELIDKDAVVAEIEKIRAKWFGINNDFADGQKGALTDVLSFLDTLEVKEVDLEKETENYLSTYWPKEIELHPFLGHMAKHFFKLGMQFQTETNITFKYNIGDSVREYKAQKEE